MAIRTILALVFIMFIAAESVQQSSQRAVAKAFHEVLRPRANGPLYFINWPSWWSFQADGHPEAEGSVKDGYLTADEFAAYLTKEGKGYNRCACSLDLCIALFVHSWFIAVYWVDLYALRLMPAIECTSTTNSSNGLIVCELVHLCTAALTFVVCRCFPLCARTNVIRSILLIGTSHRPAESCAFVLCMQILWSKLWRDWTRTTTAKSIPKSSACTRDCELDGVIKDALRWQEIFLKLHYDKYEFRLPIQLNDWKVNGQIISNKCFWYWNAFQ